MKIVSCLDVTFNLNDGACKPYTKQKNKIKSIHKNSSHPPNVIHQVPLTIELRFSTLSYNEKIFKEFQRTSYINILITIAQAQT